MVVRYKVDGMTCQGCANAVSRAVQSATRADRALVDLKEGTVEVEGAASADEVRAAVEAAGFIFKGAV